MNGFSVLHGSAWSGAGTAVVGVITGDQISYATGVAIAVASALVAGGLALYGRIQDERRRQEWLDFELRQKMAAEARARVAVAPDRSPDRQAGGPTPIK